MFYLTLFALSGPGSVFSPVLRACRRAGKDQGRRTGLPSSPPRFEGARESLGVVLLYHAGPPNAIACADNFAERRPSPTRDTLTSSAYIIYIFDSLKRIAESLAILSGTCYDYLTSPADDDGANVEN